MENIRTTQGSLNDHFIWENYIWNTYVERGIEAILLNSLSDLVQINRKNVENVFAYLLVLGWA